MAPIAQISAIPSLQTFDRQSADLCQATSLSHGPHSSPPPFNDFQTSRLLEQQAAALIPGGSHTYAKGTDQFPQMSPGFIARGQGCHVWDVDGNEFIEYGMGLRAVTLGHAFPRVVDAVAKSLQLGTNFSRPSALEVQAAERFLQVLPQYEMVKFAKNGSDVTTASVKLARAYTGRSKIAVCADHPFFSCDDWFMTATPMHAGIPTEGDALTLKFRYNDVASVEALFAAHPHDIAALILEPATSVEPAAGYLASLRALCDRHGCLLIFDEMITGFRFHLRGASAEYNVTPDLATFGKALANGFALSALTGRREIMQQGGLMHDHDRVFLLSTTHGAETTGLVAGMETMRCYEELNVIEVLDRQGKRLARGVAQVVSQHGLQGRLGCMGRPCNLVYFTRDASGQPSQALRALFMQEMIRHGILGPSFVVSFSHTDTDIDRTIDAFDRSASVYARALSEGVEKYLIGPPVKPVMRQKN